MLLLLLFNILLNKICLCSFYLDLRNIYIFRIISNFDLFSNVINFVFNFNVCNDLNKKNIKIYNFKYTIYMEYHKNKKI